VNFANEKSDLRLRYRRERSEHSLDTPYSLLVETKEISSAKVIASYISYGDEPNTQELNREIIKAGKKLLLPRIIDHGMEWVQWDGDLEKLKARGKILEPTGEAFTDVEKIDVVIVPALRVDRRGYRLGQGGGYYDRALPHLSAWSIALIFPEEIAGEDLPNEEHDFPVDAYATYDMVVRIN